MASEAEVPGFILISALDYKENEKEYEKLTLPKNWQLKQTKGESMGDKTREIWSEVLATNPSWIGLLNDDHFCVTKKWDKVIDGLIDGTNMVSTNDGYWCFGVKVCGLTAWSLPLLEAAGFPIFPKNLQHLYIDDCWKAIGESTGCWRETMRVNIEHRHVMKGEMEKDDTFNKVYAAQSWEHDAKEFKEFMEQDFKAVVERILALRYEGVIKDKFA